VAVEIKRVAGKYNAVYRLNSNESIDIQVDRIRQHRDGRLTSKMDIRASLLQGRANLYQGQLNLMSTRSRNELVKTLNSRIQREDINWDQLMEEVCQKVLEGEDETTEASRLEIMDPKDPDYLVYPCILDRLPTLWYAQGGVGKTMMAMYFAFVVQNGLSFMGKKIEKKNVLYCDWEVDMAEAGRRISYFARNFQKDQEIEMPYYRRCVLPIFDEASEIAEDVEKNDIGLIIVDSAGPAAGGDVGNLDLSVSFFNALRKITASGNVSSVTLTHVTKMERRDQGKARLPIGSVYFENIPRITWELRPQDTEDEKEMSIGFFCRKCNFKYPKPFGLNMHFNDITASVKLIDPEDIPSEEKGLEDAMLDEMAGGSKTPKELAEAVGSTVGSVRVKLTKLKKKGKVTSPERGKWGLASKKEEWWDK